MNNPFCHIELSTDDPARAREFYGKVFSWKFEEAPMPDGTKYTMIKPGEGPGGGMMKKSGPQVPTAWLTYVQVDSVEATVAKARQFGGKIIVDKTPIPGMGAFAVLTDPTGGTFGLFEANKK